MVGAFFRDTAAAGSALEKAELQEVGLVIILDRAGLVAGQGGDSGQTDGAIAVVFEHKAEHIAIGGIEAEFVDFHQLQGTQRHLVVDNPVAVYVGVIADAVDEAVRDAGSFSGARREKGGGGRLDFRIEDFRGAVDDLLDFGFAVIFEAVEDPEAVAKRTGEGAGAGRGADYGELREVEADVVGGGAFPDDDVEFIIFHRGVEDFFDGAAETVDFVDEEDVAFLEIGEDAGEVAGALDCWARGDAEICAHFVSDYVCHSGFPETRGAVEENVIQSRAVVALFYCVDGEAEIRFHTLLADIVREGQGAERFFELLLFEVSFLVLWFDDALDGHVKIIT